jgi:hypothetical protein
VLLSRHPKSCNQFYLKHELGRLYLATNTVVAVNYPTARTPMPKFGRSPRSINDRAGYQELLRTSEL